MKTLYISDLDGTLLRSDETLSDYTKDVICRLTKQGMLFSYATARSFVTAKKVTNGLPAKIPLIVYNGTFVIDNLTEEILISNYFDDSVKPVLDDLFDCEIYPIVYSYTGNKERFSFMEEKCTAGMKRFLDTRKDDRRTPVRSTEELTMGKCFHISCIDEPQKLYPIYEKYQNNFHCIYDRDFYSGDQWLEIMPKNVSKANAVMQLKEKLCCDRVVAFGDGKNDLEMFTVADECYAVENAVTELKEIATAVIAGNNEDGVAKWLEQHYIPVLDG